MTTINNLFDSICIQGIPTGNDFMSGSMIVADINNRYVVSSNDASDYFVFNVNRAITYGNDIVLKMLISHPLFETAIFSRKMKAKILNRILSTTNMRLLEAIFPIVDGAKELVYSRLDFIENECPLSSFLNERPFHGIVYDEYSNGLADKLLIIEDILDDYAFFEEFTGISLNDPFLLDKIKAFLGERMEFSDISFFLKLRDEFQQKM